MTNFWEKTRNIGSKVLAVIGVTGIADGVFRWRDFFETGFMHHYRTLKTLLLEYVPFDMWQWLPEYLVLGTIAMTALRLGYEYPKSLGRDRFLLLVYKQNFSRFARFVFWTMCLFVWPFVLAFAYFYLTMSLYFDDTVEELTLDWDDRREQNFSKAQIAFQNREVFSDGLRQMSRMLKHMGVIIVFSLIVLFLAADFGLLAP